MLSSVDETYQGWLAT